MKLGQVAYIADNGIGFIQPTDGGREAVLYTHDAYDPEIFGEIQTGDVVQYIAADGVLQPASGVIILQRPENQVG